MCMKLPLGDLNFDPYPPHPISTYTSRVTNASKVTSTFCQTAYTRYPIR